MQVKETVLPKETMSLKDMLKNRVMVKDMLQIRKRISSLEIGGRLSGFISWIQPYRQIESDISFRTKKEKARASERARLGGGGAENHQAKTRETGV